MSPVSASLFKVAFIHFHKSSNVKFLWGNAADRENAE
uniref:Uncharacterized protein n=1 Tax=Anguilla anguilla TaxID=7936 RepID=A0A0E9RXF7_ANGAN